jgi:hypothetical protein
VNDRKEKKRRRRDEKVTKGAPLQPAQTKKVSNLCQGYEQEITWIGRIRLVTKPIRTQKKKPKKISVAIKQTKKTTQKDSYFAAAFRNAFNVGLRDVHGLKRIAVCRESPTNFHFRLPPSPLSFTVGFCSGCCLSLQIYPNPCSNERRRTLFLLLDFIFFLFVSNS